MLLVLHDIGGYGLVAQLAQLDPDLVGCNLVGPAAHDCPVFFPPDNIPGREPDGILLADHPLHERRYLLELPQLLCDTAFSQGAEQFCHEERQDVARGYLRVKGLGRGDRHLYVATIARIEHPVDLAGDIGLSAVHDGYEVGPALFCHCNGPVGVRGGA